VSRWTVGDAVCALLPGGGYAEYAIAPAEHVLPVPEGLTLGQAAALPETYFTVWTNVFERGDLRAGERFLVHGGSSGIGTTAIQLARLFGARVFATAGSSEKCAACVALGAERAVNYRDEDYVSTLREAAGGVDLSLNMVGGDYIARDIKLLAEDGRLVMIAFLNGPKVTANLAPAMVKRLTITGSTLRPQSVAAKARIARELEAQVWPHLASGRVAPVMDQSFDLEDAKEAHGRMESSAHIGKIILTL
ncbi:MAG: NAD(P)H-quinone oxidoreductase, partial [Pseudomonadota bacterium]